MYIMLRKPQKLYLLIVFNDLEQKEIIYLGKFKKIKDILAFTKNKLKYSDVAHKETRCYNTYKNLFRIVKVSQLDKIKFFN